MGGDLYDDDPATSPLASERPDFAAYLDRDLDVLREIVNQPDAVAIPLLQKFFDDRPQEQTAFRIAGDLFRAAMISIIESRSPRREAWVWAFAASMECTMGVSMAAVADKLHVTKQAISKAVNDRIDQYGLRRNPNLRSNSLRSNCRQAQHRRNGTAPGPRAFNGRIHDLVSVESVALKFRGWYRTASAAQAESWSVARRRYVLSTLAPVVRFYERIKASL